MYLQMTSLEHVKKEKKIWHTASHARITGILEASFTRQLMRDSF